MTMPKASQKILTILEVILIALVMIVIMNSLHEREEADWRIGLLLTQWETMVNQLDALEWRTVMEQRPEESLHDHRWMIEEQLRTIAEELARLDQYGHRQARESAYLAYRDSRDKELQLIMAGQGKQALTIRKTQTTPLQEQLRKAIDRERTAHERSAYQASQAANLGLALGLFISTGLIGFLFWRLERAQQTTQRLEQQEQMNRQVQEELEHQVAIHTAELVEANTALQMEVENRKQAEQIKDDLVSTVSHELRTPLTSLRGFTELMLQREFPLPKLRQFLTIMHKESIRLSNLINDFLDLQRIDSGRQEYHFEALSLPSLLHESVNVFSGGKELCPFHLVLSPHLPPVCADRERIQQVLANLLSNAVKFSPDGSAVIIGAQARNEEAIVWVKDQGVGIPQEAMPKLFGKFFRVDDQNIRATNGTGLGLALTKKIVEAHQGRIWVESTVGAGSTFFFTLPLAQVEQRDVALL